MLNPDTFWEKNLKTGETERGDDLSISKGEASWTKGRQDIVSASLVFSGRRVQLICPPIGEVFATWQQLDNCCYSACRDFSWRLSRELRCTNPGYTHLTVRGYGEIECLLSNNGNIQIPDDAREIILRVDTDGAVHLGFEK